MYSIKLYFFLIPMLLLVACSKSEFKLEFNLNEDITDNFNVTYYAVDAKGGVTVQAVASVREGKCELNGITRQPTLAYITMRRSKFPLVVYANKGSNIKISGNDVNPLTWDVEGDEINGELSEWRLQNKEVLLQAEPDSINMAVTEFVEQNRQNPVSTILMLSYYNRTRNEYDYNRLMSELKDEAHSRQWLDVTARADQLSHSYSYPARLKSMILRGAEHNVDTLITDGKNPVFIAFWQTGYSEKKNLIDSLKVLEKEVPDTVKILADICLDIDSVGWRNAIRKDSLENVKRFWTPLGYYDPTISRFSVKSLPYFIVFDKEGTQSFRGTDISEAMKAYRQLVNQSDSFDVSKKSVISTNSENSDKSVSK